MYISGKILTNTDDLSQAFMIRREVFVEEQGIPEELVFDEMDQMAIHVIVYEECQIGAEDSVTREQKPVGSGRLCFDGSTCKLGRIAVQKDHRGKRYGDFMVRMLLQRAFTAGIQEVTIDAQTSVEEFYKKIGFQRVGENFMEVGKEHCKMRIEQKHIRTSCRK